ncbi:hypothetical protein NQZ79_g5572 [Umbelopsis isabellina]|nr:hypothetical protein NQZ79_g5572 [Umbelopsis isabellina]
MKRSITDIYDSWITQKSTLWKRVIKATIGYEICSILCLVPAVASALGAVPYLLPLGALFFHAGTTIGCQIEQIWLNFFLMIIAATWCGVIGYLITLYNHARVNMGIPLYDNGGSVIAAIAFFLCVFVIAYYRLKYPRLFTPSLEAFTLPFFTLTKQLDSTSYSIMMLLTIVYPPLIGGGIALLVNILLWPETAAKNHELSLHNAFYSIRMVFRGIQNEYVIHPNVTDTQNDAKQPLSQVSSKLQSDITALRKAAAEAKYELVVSHYSASWLKPTTKSIEKVASILVSTTLAVEEEKKIILVNNLAANLGRQRIINSNGAMTSSNNNDDDKEEQYESTGLRRRSNASREYLTNPISPYSTIQKIEYKQLSSIQQAINPHVNEFLSICNRCFCAIQYRLSRYKVFSSDQELIENVMEDEDLSSIDNSNLKTLITNGLRKFQDVEKIIQNGMDRGKSHPQEDHFLVYTLVFSLSECGHEIMRLDDHTKELVGKRTRYPHIWIPKVSLKNLLKKTSRLAKGSTSPATQAIMENQDAILLTDMRRTASRLHQDPHQALSDDKDDMDDIEATYGIPLHNAPGKHWWNRVLLAMMHWFQYGPTQYAFKFAISMEILALPAWLPVPGLNNWYNENHGQWALLSGMVVSNFTIGATLLQSMFRIVATIIGAIWGYIALLAAHRTDPYILAVMVLVFAGPFWFIFLGSKYPRIGFISLLTLVVIVNTGHVDMYGETTFEIVWKRTVTAIIAVLVVMVVNYLMWPMWAREEMRKQLALLLMDTGIYYFQVASLACHSDTQSRRWQTTFKETELASKSLRKRLDTVTELLAMSASEPRLTKSSFPRAVYASILEHERNILFWISHMKRSQTFITTGVRDMVMNPVNHHRKEMAAAVHLYLFTLAGSLRNKAALPASLPSAEVARQHLQVRLGELWTEVHQQRQSSKQITNLPANSSQDQYRGRYDKSLQNGERQMYWQTYAAGSVQVINEQEAMGELIVKLMGQHVFRVAEKNWARM